MNTIKDKWEKKILVISWFFPPINAAEGIVTFKLLNKSMYNYDIFTQGNNDKYAFKEDDKLKSKNIHKILSNTLDKKTWINEAVNYYLEHKDEYFCVMTRCMPRETCEVGLKIKKKDKNVFWIASFSDPLAYSPYTKITEEQNPYTNKKKTVSNVVNNTIWHLRRLHYRTCTDPEKKNKKIQRETFKKADLIIFNNEYQMEYMLSKYKKMNIKNKSTVIPHTYDELFYKKTNKFYKNKKVMTFLGHLDDFRNANAFLKAVLELKNKDKDLKDKIEFKFYGNLGKKDREFIEENKMQDVIKICDSVTYMESLDIMCKSDWLLLIDADLKEYLKDNIFFASKIVDYLGSKSKVFAITMESGISGAILKKAGAVVTNFNVDNIYDALYNIIYKSVDYNSNDEFINTFKNDEVVKKIDNLLNNVSKKLGVVYDQKSNT